MGCVTSNNNSKDVTLESATINNIPKFSLAGIKTRAKIIDVYDGDTVTIAFCFNNSVYQKRCRIQGVDCAEIKTRNNKEKEIGLEAKQFVSDLILNKIVHVEFSEKEDKYGRLLARIFLIENKDNTEAIAEEVSQMLIEKGFGYAYNGEKKKEFSQWHTIH